MTAPVVNRLRERIPGLTVTLRTALPRRLLAARFEGDWALQPASSDIGMVMGSALDIHLEATARAYVDFHADWEAKVSEEADALSSIGADLVLANVPYLTLAAAKQADIPAVALSSLNWQDIYGHYFAHRPESNAILADMRAAYASALRFLQPEPSMPMADLPNRLGIGPIARTGCNRGAEIRKALGIAPDTRLVLLATGGLPLRLELDRWPRIPGIRWLLAFPCPATRDDVTRVEDLDMSLIDILASADAVVGKPGYGTATEVACNGVPMLFVRRPDWPEDPVLVDWMLRHARALEIPRTRLESGDLSDALAALWAQPAPLPVETTGAGAAAEFLIRQLPRR